MAKKKPTADSPEPAFEEAMSELETIVRRLEQGGGELEKALEDYSNAVALMNVCHKKLEDAERRIEIVSGVDADGNPVLSKVEDSESSLEEKRETRSARRTSTHDASPATKSKKNPSDDSSLF